MNKTQKVKTLKFWLVTLLAVLTILLISTTSLAYFNFMKTYEGSGNLPKLTINYTVSGGSLEALRNIAYTGQESTDIIVSLSTNENNISGFVRAKVAFSWSNSLNNTPYNDDNDMVTACSVINSQTSNLWEFRNGYYYLKEPMEKDSEIVLFDKIVFGNKISAYRGERVSLYIIAEIYQTTNLPTNW